MSTEEDDNKLSAVRLAFKLRSNKGHLTRYIKEAEGQIVSHERSPSLASESGLTKVRAKIVAKLDEMDEIVTLLADLYTEEEIVTLEGTSIDTEKKVTEINTKIDTCITSNRDKISRHETGSRDENEEGDGEEDTQEKRPHFKAISEMKPSILKGDSSREDFRIFMEQYAAYYTASNFGSASKEVQSAFLFNVLDNEIRSRLVEKLDKIEDNNLITFELQMEYLKEIFTEKIPIFATRISVFNSKQHNDESFSAMKARMFTDWRSADMNTIEPDQLWVLKLTSSVTDEKLKEKLLELNDPDEEKIVAVARAYENSKLNLSSLPKDHVSRRAGAEASFKGNCGACGMKGHKSRDCRKKHKLVCKKCKGKGHSEGTFLCPIERKKREGSESDKRTKSPKRGNQKSNKSVADATSEDDSSTPPESDEDDSKQQRSRRSKTKHRTRTTKTSHHKCSKVDKTDETPMLECRIIQSSKQSTISFTHDCLPDTGSTQALIAKSLIKKHGIKYDKNAKVSLTDASGQNMSVFGIATIRVKPKTHKDKRWSAKDGTVVKAIVTDSIKDEIFLAWKDLINIGVISRNFPTPQSYDDIPDLTEDDESDDEDDDDEGEDYAKINKSRKSTGSSKIHDLLNKYNDIFTDKLDTNKKLKGESKIYLREDGTEPYHATTARRPARAHEKACKQLINELLESKIIEQVEETSEWCAPAHFVPKPGTQGKMRLVTDYTLLNRQVKRPIHGFSTAQEIRQQLKPSSTHYVVIDLVHGYYQNALEKESAKLTTFIVNVGEGTRRYKYLRSPMGLSASGDEFCRKTDQAIEGLENTHKLVDDVLIEGSSEEELCKHTEEFLKRARDADITISRSKIQAGSKVKFAGFLIEAQDGEPPKIMPLPEKLAAIRDFPEPEDRSSLRTFVGMLNQIADWTPDRAQCTEKMSKLLSTKVEYDFDENVREEFELAKRNLTDPEKAILRPFKESLPTYVLTDASRLKGLGFIVLQLRDDGSGKYNIILCGSCTLKPHQRRYAIIELEALAIHFAIKKSRYYLEGLPRFTVITDHRPLEGIFKKDIRDIENPRLQKIRENLMTFSFDVKYTKGKLHLAADALSRNPLFNTMTEEEDVTDVLHRTRRTFTRYTHNYARQDPKLKDMFEAAKDPRYQEVVEVIRNDTNPRKLPKDHPSQEYVPFLNKMSIIDGEENPLLIYDDSRIVVPATQRQRILKKLHIPHQAAQKTLSNAKYRYFWTSMATDVKEMCNNCETCVEFQPSQWREPMSNEGRTSLEELEPMEEVGVDIAEIDGKNFIIMVDRHSAYPFCEEIRKTGTEDIVKVLRKWFLDFSYPRKIRADYGPAFRENFGTKMAEMGIVWERSSAYHSQSNGMAEQGVKRIKRCIRKAKRAKEPVDLALAELRLCPMIGCKASPAEIFFKREMRGELPSLKRDIGLKESVREREERRKKYAEKTGGKKRKSKNFNIGDKVMIQNEKNKRWEKKGKISKVRNRGRSYYITTKDGSEYLRNKRFLKRAPKKARGESDSQAPRTESSRADRQQAGASHTTQEPRRSPRLSTKDKGGQKVRFGIATHYSN